MIVNNLVNWQTLLEVMLGISLSAAAGFRVFVPLLMLSVMSVLGGVAIRVRTDAEAGAETGSHDAV